MLIYDLGFFRAIAKLPAYKLICAWYGEQLIGTLVMVEELSIVHSMVCGLDYEHSKMSFTYSKLYYEFIAQAIAAGNFKIADAGVTADQAKKLLGLAPRPAVVEISVQSTLLRAILRLVHPFVKISLDTQNALCVGLRWPLRPPA